MPVYRYKARDKEGTLLVGSMEATREDAVAERLSGMGYLPVRIVQQREPLLGRIPFPGALRSRRSAGIALFARQFADLAAAGVALEKCLATLESGAGSSTLRDAIRDIRRGTGSGSALSDALLRHPALFDPLFVSIVRAGEDAGRPAEALQRAAAVVEHRERGRERVRAAVRQPATMIVVVGTVFLASVATVMPRLEPVLARITSGLPFPTRVLLGISSGLQQYGMLILGALLAAVLGMRWFARSTSGRPRWDRWKLGMPVLGSLLRTLAISNFARAVSVLLQSGFTPAEALDIAAESSGNRSLARAAYAMRESVRQGRTVAVPMRESGLFPLPVVRMVEAGEAGGDLGSTMAAVSEACDRLARAEHRGLSALLTASALLLTAATLLLLVLGILLPLGDLLARSGA